MHAYVYKSLKKADTYAYLARRDDFDCLPEPVRKQLGELRFVLDVALVEGRKLALADPAVVRTILTAGTPMQYQDAPEFSRFVAADAAAMAGVVRRIGKQ